MNAEPNSRERKRLDPGRHEAGGCKVCAHPDREQIEDEFCSWANTSKLAKDYGLPRDSIYRHISAFNLKEKRARNIRAALERIIEQADGVQVNASAVVAAIQAYAKINAQGAWVEKTERIDMNALFERMTREELETYARERALPDYFKTTVGATDSEGQEESSHG
jgi:hypothetical protein